jgi:NADPH2:quinone reductase
MTARRSADYGRAWRSDKPGIGALEIAEMPKPKPAAGELLVAVEAAALNFSDILMVRDQYQIKPERPFVPGQEICGTIIEFGDGAEVKAGARVAGKVVSGGFAEHAVMRADMALEIPDDMPAVDAAALPISYTTAMMALDHCGELKPGDSILVHAAAGGLGLAALQVAAARGARVFATAGSDAKRQLTIDNGAEAAFHSRGAEWREEIMAATGGRGVDMILDSIGGEATLESIRALAYGGTLLIAGFLSGDIPKIAAHRLLLKRLRAIGVYWSHDQADDQPLLAAIQREIVAMYGAGAIRPHIGETFAFSDLPAALRALDEGRGTGKLAVLTR